MMILLDVPSLAYGLYWPAPAAPIGFIAVVAVVAVRPIRSGSL